MLKNKKNNIMKKNIKEQAAPPANTAKAEPPKNQQNLDEKKFFEDLYGTYKCPYLFVDKEKTKRGSFHETKEGKKAFKVVKNYDHSQGNFKSGDTLYLYSDFTLDRYTNDGKNKKNEKWFCKAYQNQSSKSQAGSGVGLTDDQKRYVDQMIKDNNYVLLNNTTTPTPEQRAAIDQNVYAPIDLSKFNRALFPEEGKYFLYQVVGKIQPKNVEDAAKAGGQMEGIIARLKEAPYNWIDNPPSVDQLQNYVKFNPIDHSIDLGGKEFQSQFPAFGTVFSGKSYKMWVPKSSPIFKDARENGKLQKAAQETTNVDRKGCKLAIELLYKDKFEKREILAPQDIIQKKEYVKMCMAQKEFRRGVDKQVEALAALPKEDKYSLAESKSKNLKSNIHESLVNLKQEKQTILLERKIVKNRLKLVVESYERTGNKTKLFKNLVYEFNYLHEQGFNDKLISETATDGGILSWLLGRSGGGIVDAFIERLIKYLAGRMGLSPFWANFMAIAFGNLEKEDLPKLFRLECSYITGILSKTSIEMILQKLSERAKINDTLSSILRNTLDSMFRDSGFEQSFQNALKTHLCPLLSKVSSNMTKVDQNLQTKVLTV